MCAENSRICSLFVTPIQEFFGQIREKIIFKQRRVDACTTKYLIDICAVAIDFLCEPRGRPFHCAQPLFYQFAYMNHKIIWCKLFVYELLPSLWYRQVTAQRNKHKQPTPQGVNHHCLFSVAANWRFSGFENKLYSSMSQDFA